MSSSKGGSLAHTQALQSTFTQHMREPNLYPAPADIEDRRLEIYRGLLYRNIEGFVSRAFPVCRKLLAESDWHLLVRDFMHRHRCKTPFFPGISAEFVEYLQGERDGFSFEPEFLPELAHYEWVEIALDTADIEGENEPVKRAGDLMRELPVLSPLAWPLSYRYPVHQIGPDYQPAEAPEQATYLIVYRNSEYAVKFMEINALTARLLVILQDPACASGEHALTSLAAEVPSIAAEQIISNGQITLDKLRRLAIIFGTRAQPGA